MYTANVNISKLITVILWSILLLLPDISSAQETRKGSTSNWEDFDIKIRVLMRLCHFPSASICLIKGETIFYSKTYGFSNFYKRKRASKETIYMVGSISKSIIATALMQLYEKGYFDLDDNVADYLPFDLRNPFFPNTNITFRMLLSHEASINDFGLRPSTVLPIRVSAKHARNYSDIVENMVEPGGRWYSSRYWLKRYRPGDTACYSNLGMIIAGCLLEELSGMSVEEYCRKYIFEPLDMRHTTFDMQRLDRKKLAQPYTSVGKLFIPLPKYDFYLLDPAGGLYTTAEDLSHFLIAHMNGGVYNETRILNESTVRLMHTVQYPESTDLILGRMFAGKIELHHGLGWMKINFLGQELKGHSGGTIGYNCHMLCFTREDGEKVGFVMLTNAPLLQPAFFSPVRTLLSYTLILKAIVKELNEL